MMVRLILYNIQYCAGTLGSWWEYLKFWRMLRAPRYLDYVIANELKNYNPDILGLIEVDLGSLRSRKKDEVTFFKEFMGFEGHAKKVKYTKKGVSGLFKKMPITRKQANAILTKNQLFGTKSHELNNGTKRIVIDTTLKYPRKYRLLLVHLALGSKTRKKQINQLIEIVNAIEEPVILMGDFNLFKGLEEIELLLKNTKLNYECSEKSHMKRYTQPSSKPSRTLDIVLTSKEIEVKKYQVLENVKYSDHLPVMIDFDFK